ncbi:MAG TPA: ParB/RepB/Spo0J family partition protein [Candidatus Saccharimonadales bacterium]
MPVNRGLGRGLDSLIPTTIEAEFDPTARQDEAISRTQMLLISIIKADPEQPRRIIKSEQLNELAASIKKHGVLQPIVVRPDGSKYFIIAGERRWRAAALAGLKSIPAIIRSLSGQQKLEVALVENIQREDLTLLETATAIAKLNQQFNQSYKQISTELGKAESTVINIARLLQLPSPAKRALGSGAISEGHARQILALSTEKSKQELLDLIVRHGWSVRRAEQYVVERKKGGGSLNSIVKRSASTNEDTKLLQGKLKTKVYLHKLAKGGRLVIEYKNAQDYNRIIARLKD